MILLDTHIWVWWVHDTPDLQPWMKQRIAAERADGIGVSAISCWEVARLVADARLDLHRPIADWFALALAYPGVRWVDLSPEICIDANNLPDTFHEDPADRLIVASARHLRCELMTADTKILNYSHVNLAVRQS